MIATWNKTGLLCTGKGAGKWSSSLMVWVLSSPQLLIWKPHPSFCKWAVGSVTPAFSGSLHLQPFYMMMRGPFDFQVQASAMPVAAGCLHKHLPHP